MRITVISTNKDLVFFPGTKGRLQRNSPMMHELGDFSFPFEIPLEENNAALNYPARLSKKGQKEFEYEVRIESRLIPDKTALLTITPNSKTVSCNLLFGMGSTNNKFKNTMLSEVMGDVITIGSNIDDLMTHINNCTDNDWPAVPYNFPVVRALDFYGDNNGEWLKRINYFAPNLAATAPYKGTLPNVSGTFNMSGPNLMPGSGYFVGFGDVSGTFYNNFTTVIPFFYFSEIFKRIFEYFNIPINDTVHYHAALKRLLIWNNRTLDNEYFPLVIAELNTNIAIPDTLEKAINLPTISTDEYDVWDGNKLRPKHPGLFIFRFDITYLENTPIVYYQLYAKKGGTTHTSDNIGAGNSTVEMYMNFTQADIDNNRHITFTTATAAVNVELLAETPNAITSMSMRSHHVDFVNIFKNTINPADHIPDMSVNDFLKGMGNIFGFNVFDDGEEVKALFKKEIINSSPIADISHTILNDFSLENQSPVGKFTFSNAEMLDISPYTLSQTVNAKSDLTPEMVNDKLLYVKNINKYFVTRYTPQFYIEVEEYTQNTASHICSEVTDATEINSSFSPANSTYGVINPEPDPLELTAFAIYLQSNGMPADFVRYGVMAEVADKAYSALFETLTDPTLQFFNWLGKIKFKGHQTGWDYYPASSNSNRDNQGTIVSGAVDLNWDSIVTEFWQDYIDFINNADKALLEIKCSETQLKRLSFTEKYVANGIEILLSSIDFEFNIATDELIGSVSLEIFKANP